MFKVYEIRSFFKQASIVNFNKGGHNKNISFNIFITKANNIF